jgi:hypothetical protein
MRKGITEGSGPQKKLTPGLLKEMENLGYRYVQVKGLTIDKHFDYIDPHYLVLVPMKELPCDEDKKDIYEPIDSDLLRQWAKNEDDDRLEIVFSMKCA